MEHESNRWTECTDRQRTLLAKLPEDPSTLAEELGVERDGVHSLVSRIRKNGYDVLYDDESGLYYPPGETTEQENKPPENGVSRPDGVVKRLEETGLTYTDFALDFDCSEEKVQRILQDLREAGYTIDFKTVGENGKRLFYIPDEHDKSFVVGDGDGVYEFALISDTHLGSEAEHLDELHDFYDRVADRGIEVVYHAGDISDGWKVHKGHINAIKGPASGWSRLKDYVVENYPKREGVDTLFIEGNHDHKYHRRNGIHFGELIASEREDLHYCGDSMARFVFDAENEIDMELIHPSGGKPYTAGYRLQTLYRERDAENRPTIAGVGHLHGSMYAKTEGVMGFYTGGWKGTTTYGKRKGHQSTIGGWIVELEVEHGEVRRIAPSWVGYSSKDEATNFSPKEIAQMTGHDVH